MKILMKKIIATFIVALSVFTLQLDARVRTIQSEREFDQQMRRAQLVVILFYYNTKASKGSVHKQNVDQLLKTYAKVSTKKLYDDADITFMKINMDMNWSAQLAQRYLVRDYPACIILNKGRVARNADGTNALLRGFFSEDMLHEFIRGHAENIIDTIVADKEQKRLKRIQDEKNPSDPYFYPSVMYAGSGDITSWTKPLRYTPEGDEK